MPGKTFNDSEIDELRKKTDRIVTEANQTTSISISLTEELKELQLSLVEAQTEGSDQDLSDLKKSVAAKMKRIEEAANSNIAKVERLQKEADLTEAALKLIVSKISSLEHKRQQA
ncbi:hypothetical protein Agabi119p4_6457 [Agaricus bisporus var. burnettii]|uniref:Uncharacterized protein n=1 Tax=Agaricus bisporus var. burnettii TaxID=192524 RepID=A0A8H7F043_AGABI|nr:hypothetical protein Agabi119p4_6457 [Agaricus bisporus var. burnettii]